MYLKIKRRELINIPSPPKTMLEVRCGSEGGSQLGTEVWPQVCGNEVAGCGGAGKWEKCGMQGAGEDAIAGFVCAVWVGVAGCG